MPKPPSSLEVERFYKGMRIVTEQTEVLAKARLEIGKLEAQVAGLADRLDRIEARLSALVRDGARPRPPRGGAG